MPTKRTPAIGFEVSDLAMGLFKKLQERTGLSQPRLFEALVKAAARTEGITIPGSGAEKQELEQMRREKEMLEARARLVGYDLEDGKPRERDTEKKKD